MLSAALSIVVTACGSSEQTRFEEALAESRVAIAQDDLELAEVLLGVAGALRPDDAEFLSARQTLQAAVASRDVFFEAERLAESGRLLEARDAFRKVARDDSARFALAQAAALQSESRWLDVTAAALDDLIASDALDDVVLAVGRARRAFPEPALEQQVIAPRAEHVLKSLAEVGSGLVAEGRFNDFEALVQRLLAIFPLSASEGSTAVREVREFAASERERIARVRSEDAARRQQEALEALQPRVPATPTPSSDCPSPVTDPAGYRLCLDARLADVRRETDVTSPAPPPALPEPTGPQSCPTFDPAIRATFTSVTGTVTEDRYGLRRLELSFDGSITNVSNGWMRIFLHSYVLYYGDQRENHPGHRTRLAAVEGTQEGDWLAPGGVHRFVRWDDLPHTVGSEAPTHIEFNAGANLRAENQPDFCDPNGSWHFDTIRAAISY